MSVLLPFLRPLAAMPFIIDGLDAVVNSDEHAQRAQGLLEYAGSYGLTTPPVALVEKAATATGAVSVVAGTALSLSIAPAASAYTLAALNVPVTLINSTYFNGRQLVVSLTPALRGAALSAGLLALGWPLPSVASLSGLLPTTTAPPARAVTARRMVLTPVTVTAASTIMVSRASATSTASTRMVTAPRVTATARDVAAGVVVKSRTNASLALSYPK